MIAISELCAGMAKRTKANTARSSQNKFFPKSKKIYEEFATGRHTLKSISARLAELGGGKARSNYSIENLLTNDRYIGIMRWDGETHEGKYRPLITKQLFAKVQEVLANRRKPRKSKKRHDFPFVGLFNCSCGSMFTAQFAKGNGGTFPYFFFYGGVVFSPRVLRRSSA